MLCVGESCWYRLKKYPCPCLTFRVETPEISASSIHTVTMALIHYGHFKKANCGKQMYFKKRNYLPGYVQEQLGFGIKTTSALSMC